MAENLSNRSNYPLPSNKTFEDVWSFKSIPKIATCVQFHSPRSVHVTTMNGVSSRRESIKIDHEQFFRKAKISFVVIWNLRLALSQQFDCAKAFSLHPFHLHPQNRK